MKFISLILFLNIFAVISLVYPFVFLFLPLIALVLAIVIYVKNSQGNRIIPIISFFLSLVVQLFTMIYYFNHIK